ncbi:unnamed protein product [Prorocentrum cordatum]|uniref:Uncharacterized protein n=1 Tax=Prorocentrum cordatum TaxID=2364126 RepID=A0ABN9SPQ5_9DINO|nr:unnamed protein product [Polarella glacialis]
MTPKRAAVSQGCGKAKTAKTAKTAKEQTDAALADNGIPTDADMIKQHYDEYWSKYGTGSRGADSLAPPMAKANSASPLARPTAIQIDDDLGDGGKDGGLAAGEDVGTDGEDVASSDAPPPATGSNNNELSKVIVHVAEAYAKEFRKATEVKPTMSNEVGAKTKELIVQMTDALKTNTVEPRSGLGQRFSTAHKPGTDNAKKLEAYVKRRGDEGVKTNDAKKEFRIQWAKEQLDSITHGKKETNEWQEVDEETGTYVPFAVLVEKMGFFFDPEGALERAKKYADKCMAMKGGWVVDDEMVEEINFFHLERKHRTILAKKWESYTQSQTGGSSAQAEDKACPDAPTATDKAKARRKSNGKNGTGDAVQGVADGAQPDGLDKLFVSAQQTKKLYHNTVGSASSLIDTIKTSNDKNWKRFNSPDFVGALTDQKAKVEQSATPFGTNLLIKDLSETKKSHTAAVLTTELEHFVTLKGELNKLAKQHNTIIKMYTDSSDLD